jgi:Mrp family chromosome partitioning ATPase
MPPVAGTRDAVMAAFRVGFDGVILSRKYSEMKLANLAGAGAAIRQLGLG